MRYWYVAVTEHYIGALQTDTLIQGGNYYEITPPSFLQNFEKVLNNIRIQYYEGKRNPTKIFSLFP